MVDLSFFERIKRRKIWQRSLAYLAGAFVAFQAVEVVAEPWGISAGLQRSVHILLLTGFFVQLVIAWYHGEKGRQRVSGPELLILAVLLVGAGLALFRFRGTEGEGGEGQVGSLPHIADDRPSLAVLPFENFSVDPAYAFFADGMQEQILSTLSDMSALRVISRSSVMQYRENRPASRQIAEELGVSFLVEGSAQISGDQVRLTVQLVDAREDEYLWSGNYDRELTAENLFEVRSEVSSQIAFRVGISLTPEERDQVARILTGDTEAYLLFMQGLQAFLQERQEGLVSRDLPSAKLFEKAIELDPRFAPAHAYLALTLAHAIPDETRMGRARHEAESALAILPGLGEARLALGRYYLWAGEAPEAFRQFQAAQQENPNMALAALELGLLQRRLGDFQTGLQTLWKAESLDPFNPVILQSLAASLVHLHQFDEGLEVMARRDSIYPSAISAFLQAFTYSLSGEPREAHAQISQVLSRDESLPFQVIPGIAIWSVTRLLSEEHRRISFDAYRASHGMGCTRLLTGCLRRAIYEEESGSPETARILWDSLASVVQRTTPSTPHEHRSVALVYQGVGDRDATIKAAEELVGLRGASAIGGVEDQFHGSEDRVFLAQILAYFSEPDRALDILEEELPAPSWLSVPLLKADPIWDPLRSQPRFQALIETHEGNVKH